MTFRRRDRDREPADCEHGHVPADLLELHEVMEWENGAAAAEGKRAPHPDVYTPEPGR